MGEVEDAALKGRATKPAVIFLGEIDFRFGFDDEEGVGVGVAGGAEFLTGVVEGGGEGGEDDFAVCAADEVEAALLLDEFDVGRQFVRCDANVFRRRRAP